MSEENPIKCSFYQADSRCVDDIGKKKHSHEGLVPLTSCNDDVSGHLNSLNLPPVNCTELDLILNRAIVHGDLPALENATVCPYHRYRYGVGFQVSRSAYDCGHPNHEGKRICDRRINKAMSENIRVTYEDKVPIGTRICRICRTDKDIQGASKLVPVEPPPQQDNPDNSILDSTFNSTYVDDSDYDVAADMTTRDVTVTIKEAANETFSSLANIMNQSITEQSYVLTSDYAETDDSTKRLLKSMLKERCLLAAQSLTPNHYEDLFDDFIESEYKKRHETMTEESWVDAVSSLLPTLNKSEKIMILSIFAYSDTKAHLVEKFNCSDRVIRAARKHARNVGAAKLPKTERIVRHRLSPEHIEHFLDFLFDTQLQTMSWGKMKMKFSDEHVEELAPVLCTNIPAHIIHLYYTYCKNEVDPSFKPLSYSTLWRILTELPTKTKKSMSGLDDYMADGLKGFTDLLGVLSTLRDSGLSNESANQLKLDIENAKQYLKGQFPINVSNESSLCADHCRMYSLSDPKKEMFRKKCDYEHSNKCSNCNQLDSLFENLDNTIKSLLDGEKQDELLYDLSIAKERIISWKKHIVRAAQQQLGKDDVLKSLTAEKGLLIVDWGMKCLPQEYLEKSKNWFGKKGMSWSFACLIYKDGEDYKKFTYVVTVEKCSQDWWSNSAVFDAVLAKIKLDHPRLSKLVDKHDNAGCYHNCYYWLAKKEICDKHSVNLEMTLMNEPAKGKDECDRMISKCRNHLRYYVNAGKDVTSASEMRDGLLWMDGVKGVSVSTISVNPSLMPDVKSFPFGIPDVTKLFVVKYGKDSMVLFRAYNIGKGMSLKYPKEKIYQENFGLIHEFSTPKHGLVPGEVGASKDTGDIWHCPNSLCLREFKSFQALRRHKNEPCTYEIRRTSMDIVKEAFSKRLDVGGETATMVTSSTEQPSTSSSQETTQATPQNKPMGWALKERKPTKRFTPSMLKWVKGYFLAGEITGKKVTGKELNGLQRTAVADGIKMFTIDDYKTDDQFKSLITRLTALFKNDKDAFSEIEVPNITPQSQNPVNQQPSDEDLESVENISDYPTYDDDYSNIAAAAALDGAVADLKKGDYISFTKEKWHKWLPGVVMDVTPNICSIRSMERSTGNAFVWPTEDKFYSVGIKDILYILDEPVFHRRYWSFSAKNVCDSDDSFEQWKRCQK